MYLTNYIKDTVRRLQITHGCSFTALLCGKAAYQDLLQENGGVFDVDGRQLVVQSSTNCPDDTFYLDALSQGLVVRGTMLSRELRVALRKQTPKDSP